MRMSATWRGRYACGCPTRKSKAYTRSGATAPFCLRHGAGFGPLTLLVRRAGYWSRGLRGHRPGKREAAGPHQVGTDG